MNNMEKENDRDEFDQNKEPQNALELEEAEVKVEAPPPPPTADIVQLLHDDNSALSELFYQFSQSDEDAEKQQLFDHIRKSLLIHSQLVEEIFYPLLPESADEEDKEEAQELVYEAEASNYVSGMILDVLSTMKPSDEYFTGKMNILHELAKQQIKREEKEMLEKLKSADLDFAELGQQAGEIKTDLEEAYESIKSKKKSAKSVTSRTGAKAKSGTTGRTGTKTKSGAKTKPGTKVKAGAKTRAGAKTKAGAKSKAGTKAKAGAKSKAGTKAKAGTKSRATTKPATKSKTGVKARSVATTKAKTASKSKAASRTKAVASKAQTSGRGAKPTTKSKSNLKAGGKPSSKKRSK
ncbi:MAG TPA: hypothetical protein V6C76_14975 [Drouetiella sp.]